MKNIRRWLFYAAYILIATVFFGYYLFPSKTVKEYIALHLSRAVSGYHLTIDRVKPAFPASLMFRDINLSYLDTPMLYADRLKVTPKLSTLMRSKTTFFFKGEVYKGMIKGKIDMIKDPSSRSVLIDTHLSDIQLTGVSAIQHLSGQKISGVLNGKVTYHHTKEAEATNAFLHISDFRVDLSTPFFSLKSLLFDDIQADINFSNQNLIINRCVVKGAQLDGRISGAIAFRHDTEKSVLNLAGAIKPHHLFLAGLGKGLSSIFFSKNKTGGGNLTFGVTGTFARPRFYIK